MLSHANRLGNAVRPEARRRHSVRRRGAGAARPTPRRDAPLPQAALASTCWWSALAELGAEPALRRRRARAPCDPAFSGRRRRAARLDERLLFPPARSRPPAVGDHALRRPRRRSLVPRDQSASLPGGRHERRVRDESDPRPFARAPLLPARRRSGVSLPGVSNARPSRRPRALARGRAPASTSRSTRERCETCSTKRVRWRSSSCARR